MRTRLWSAITLAAVVLGGAAGCAGQARKGGAAPAAAAPAEYAVSVSALAELATRVSAALPGCPVETAADAVLATMPASRVFASDSADLQSDAGAALSKLAHLLHACRGCVAEVVVHTDAIGPAAANLEFSGQRAAALAAWLQSAGVPEARLHARGAGEGVPVADNSTPAGRQANRRIEISIRP